MEKFNWKIKIIEQEKSVHSVFFDSYTFPEKSKISLYQMPFTAVCKRESECPRKKTIKENNFDGVQMDIMKFCSAKDTAGIQNSLYSSVFHLRGFPLFFSTHPTAISE